MIAEDRIALANVGKVVLAGVGTTLLLIVVAMVVGSVVIG